MSSDLQPLYSLLEDVQRQKNAILCSRPVRTDPADFHRYLDHLTAHGPELGDPARLVDQCIRQAETGVQELVQSLFEEEQQHWYRAERLLSHQAERPLSPAAPAPTSAPARAPIRAPATTPAVPAASRADRARPPQLATERRAQQRRERQRPPPPPPPPRAAPPRAAARGAAPPAAPRGHHSQREPPAAVGAGAAPTAAVPLSRPRHLEDTARAALFPSVGGGEPPAPPPPPPPQHQPPAAAPRAPPLLAYEEFQSARRPRRVVAPPADSVRLVHLGLDESSDGSDDQEPPLAGPEDALPLAEEPPPALEESEPQQEEVGKAAEGGASGPPRPPTSVGADSEPPTPRPAEPEETAGQGGQGGGGEEGGARLAAGADTDGAGPPDRQSAGRVTDIRGSSGGRRGARSTPATGGRSGGDRRRADRAAAGVRRTPSAGGDARRSPDREPAVLRPAPSVGGPEVRWRDGPPAVPALGGHRPRARSDVRADVTWVPMDTGVFSSAGRQRTSGETKRKLEINAYKLIQEVVAASMAGCGDSPGSSRSDDVTGSSESVRQTARSPAAVAADALAAELDRAVADHRLPTAQFSSCSSRSGGPSPSEEGQAAGGPTGAVAAAERAGAGQTPQQQPPQLQEKQPPPPPQQQQGRQFQQRQQEPQEQERQQQHQQHQQDYQQNQHPQHQHQQHQQDYQQQQQHHQHQQQQLNQQPQHQQANRPREDGDRPGQRQSSSPPSPPPKPPRALPAAESRSDPAETVSEATGPPSEVSPSVALPSLSRSAPPSEGRSAAAAPADSDPDLEWLQRQAPVGGSGEHSAAETDDQVSDTALESDGAGLTAGGDSDSPAVGERHTESGGRPQVTPGMAMYQRTVTEPPSAGGCLTALPAAGGCLTALPSAGGCLTAPPSAGGCLTALPAAGRTLGRPPQPPLSPLTDTGCGTGCGSSAVTSPGGRRTPKGGRRPHPAAAAAAPSPAPAGQVAAAPVPAVRAPAAAPRWADRAPAAGAAQVAVERTAPGRLETAAQTSQSLLPATVVSPQSEEGSSSALLQSGCCQTTPPAGLSAACQTQPDIPDRQQAGCQTETPGGAAENLSLPLSPHGGATGHRPAQRTGGDGSLSRSDSSGHRSTASGEDLSEGEVLLPAWLRWVGAAGSATTVRSSAVTLAAASRHTIGSHPTEQEGADTTLSEGEVTGDTVPVGTFPSMSVLGPVRSALGPGPSGTTLGPSGTTLGPSRSTLGPSVSQLSAGQRRSSHLTAGDSQLTVSRGQLAAGRGSLPPSVPSVGSVPVVRTASDSRLSAVRAGPAPPSAARSEVSGRPAARAASSPRLSTVCDRPSARRRRSWAAPAPAPAGDRPRESGDLSDGEVSGSVRVRHVHIRPVRAGPTFELGEEGGPAPASEGLWSEGEAAEDGGLWTDQASLP